MTVAVVFDDRETADLVQAFESARVRFRKTAEIDPPRTERLALGDVSLRRTDLDLLVERKRQVWAPAVRMCVCGRPPGPTISCRACSTGA